MPNGQTPLTLSLNGDALDQLWLEGSQARVDLRHAVCQNFVQRNFSGLITDPIAKEILNLNKIIENEVRKQIIGIDSSRVLNVPTDLNKAITTRAELAVKTFIDKTVTDAVLNFQIEMEKKINDSMVNLSNNFEAAYIREMTRTIRLDLISKLGE